MKLSEWKRGIFVVRSIEHGLVPLRDCVGRPRVFVLDFALGVFLQHVLSEVFSSIVINKCDNKGLRRYLVSELPAA